MQSLHRNASSVGIILGGKVVMNVENLPQAMHIVFGLTYALHLNYPKFFLQKVLLNSNFKHSRISRKVEGSMGSPCSILFGFLFTLQFSPCILYFLPFHRQICYLLMLRYQCPAGLSFSC